MESLNRPRLTPFVLEVVLPGLGNAVPVIDKKRCRFALEVRPSAIHRWGIFAIEPVPQRRRVIEYTGQKIDTREAWRRSVRQHLYVFWLNDRWALDGAFGGSGAEFINHSCDPNLTAFIKNDRIFLSSNRPIKAGEELTLDYNTGEEYNVAACTCGSVKCRGFIGT
jgi:SET domain-containing protein